MAKKSPKQQEKEYLEQRKADINRKWDEFMHNPTFDKEKLVLLMEEMNSVDRMIIRHKRRDLLN